MPPKLPLEHLSSAADPDRRTLRARVTRVHKDPTGTKPSFLFSVSPLVGGMSTGHANGEIDNVVMLQAGFGSLDRESPPPSGIVYVPEVGSIVKCDWDGSRWCIVGCYTGPMKTRVETARDAERRLVSYDPGIEADASRRQGRPGWDLPHWSYGIEAGDCVMGRENARVKVTAQGAVIGADLDACRVYTRDGRILERFADREVRGVGFWENQRFRRGANPEARRTWIQNPQFAEPPLDLSTTYSRIVEVGALAAQLHPYILEQRGYVSRSVINDGRSAMTTDVPAQTAIRELETRDYVVSRQAVVTPTATDPRKPGGELDTQAVTEFDHQVDADGSFRIRAGNLNRAVGAQTKRPTAEMDLSIDYDANAEELVLHMGRAGYEATKIVIRGRDSSQAAVSVVTSSLRAEVRDHAELKAASARVEASKITLRGSVRIEGDIRLTGNLVAEGDIKSRGIDLAKHIHGGVDTGGGSTSAPA